MRVISGISGGWATLRFNDGRIYISTSQPQAAHLPRNVACAKFSSPGERKAMSRSGAAMTDPTRLAPPDPGRHHLRERLSATASRAADMDADVASRGRALSPLGLGTGDFGGTAVAAGAGPRTPTAEVHAVRRSGGGGRRRERKKRAAPIPWKKLLWVRQSCRSWHLCSRCISLTDRS
jgi:hypothetical protein